MAPHVARVVREDEPTRLRIARAQFRDTVVAATEDVGERFPPRRGGARMATPSAARSAAAPHSRKPRRFSKTGSRILPVPELPGDN